MSTYKNNVQIKMVGTVSATGHPDKKITNVFHYACDAVAAFKLSVTQLGYLGDEFVSKVYSKVTAILNGNTQQGYVHAAGGRDGVFVRQLDTPTDGTPRFDWQIPGSGQVAYGGGYRTDAHPSVQKGNVLTPNVTALLKYTAGGYGRAGKGSKKFGPILSQIEKVLTGEDPYTQIPDYAYNTGGPPETSYVWPIGTGTTYGGIGVIEEAIRGAVLATLLDAAAGNVWKPMIINQTSKLIKVPAIINGVMLPDDPGAGAARDTIIWWDNETGTLSRRRHRVANQAVIHA